ncbi:hypothetical protein CEP52_010187 [Fusarium oligoseptatum]|uniref:Uncharacterized protein n=1 Tax=Fusarium oligoseptatum TaxID=2604345 RepID=A0A428T9F7_9HYPO|nr:hypothetical protein CEP52_010187 [Fusarium oligoseptatum]
MNGDIVSNLADQITRVPSGVSEGQSHWTEGGPLGSDGTAGLSAGAHLPSQHHALCHTSFVLHLPHLTNKHHSVWSIQLCYPRILQRIFITQFAGGAIASPAAC